MNTPLQESAAKHTSFVWPGVILAALLVGLGLRVWLLTLAPHTFFGDHFDNIGMGVTAEQYGLLKVYSVPVDKNPVISGPTYSWSSKRIHRVDRRVPRVANYPPLAVTIFWLQAKSLYAIDPKAQANTIFSRLWMAIIPVVFDLIMAIGVFLVGQNLAGQKGGIVAATVSWLFPPIMLDSAFWGQTDSWVLAPTMLAIWFMLRRHWIAVGLVLGIASMLKPQTILLGPAVLFAAAILPRGEDSSALKAFAIRACKVTSSGLLIVAIIALPWIIADGLAWLQQSYLNNLKMYPLTTLKAFNLWYLDALQLEASSSARILDSTVRVGPFTKDLWGHLLTLLSIPALAILCWHSYRKHAGLAVVLFTGLWLWSTFVWPTRVHERYIVYCMPLIITATACLRRLWPAILVLAAVGTAEMTWYNWLNSFAGQMDRSRVRSTHMTNTRMRAGTSQALSTNHRHPFEVTSQAKTKMRKYYHEKLRPKERPWEYLATISLLLAYAYAVVLPFVRPVRTCHAILHKGARSPPGRQGLHKRRS